MVRGSGLSRAGEGGGGECVGARERCESPEGEARGTQGTLEQGGVKPSGQNAGQVRIAPLTLQEHPQAPPKHPPPNFSDSLP